MTRINCVPVHTLTDKHCIAEYKEITRPFNKMITRIDKYGINKALTGVTISDKYILNKGHERFFFNKLEWLMSRYEDLYIELVGRGFNIDPDKFCSIYFNFVENLKNTPYWNNWTPTPEDMYLNMSRLCKRSNIESVLEELKSED